MRGLLIHFRHPHQVLLRIEIGQGRGIFVELVAQYQNQLANLASYFLSPAAAAAASFSSARAAAFFCL